MKNKIIFSSIIVILLIVIGYFIFSDTIQKESDAVCGNNICDNQNEIFSCIKDCPCFPEGIKPLDFQYKRNCCEGLQSISDWCNPDKEKCPVGSAGYCTSQCGNGVCDNYKIKDSEGYYIESNYNCPADCS